MTDKAVSALTSLTGANTATGDLLYIVDISEAAAADRSKKITAQELQNYLKKFPATIAVGNATPAASGAGVSFPATASASSDANTLDDYEEGDWASSMGLQIGGGSTGITYDNRVGKYTKVGNKVCVTGGLLLSSKGALTGGVEIVGLPFASTNPGPYGDATVAFGFVNSTNFTTVPPLGLVVRGDSKISLFKMSGGNSSNVQETDITNTSALIFSATYFV